MADEEKPVNGAEIADNVLVVKLRKKVIANGEEVDELRFREPTAADIERCGTPVTFDMTTVLAGIPDAQPKMTYENKSMFAMMSTLAAVPPSTIKMMNTQDWQWAALQIAVRFFIP